MMPELDPVSRFPAFNTSNPYDCGGDGGRECYLPALSPAFRYVCVLDMWELLLIEVESCPYRPQLLEYAGRHGSQRYGVCFREGAAFPVRRHRGRSVLWYDNLHCLSLFLLTHHRPPADIKDGQNFTKTQTRHYRGALSCLPVQTRRRLQGPCIISACCGQADGTFNSITTHVSQVYQGPVG